jgi:hypothetical protein
MTSRRDFLKATAVGGAVCGLAATRFAAASAGSATPLISPGCRKSKVRIAKIYLGKPGAHWPHPKMDIQAEQQKYEGEFARMKDEFKDVEFVSNRLVTTADEAKAQAELCQDVDGVLAIHLSMGIMDLLPAILAAKKPTFLFAHPYSGHEWTGFGGLRQKPEGALFECELTSDYNRLAAGIRPFRAIHHLREAKVLNVTTRQLPESYLKSVKAKYGTEIKVVGRDRVIAAYDSIPDAAAEAEAKQWIDGAQAIVEPARDEIVRSCQLALGMQKILDEEEATVVTVDCYGTMWRQIPAYPCISHARMNSMGLGGICESDLKMALTHILFQGLTGRPSFISDPTVDASKGAIILAHCMGTPKMDGPDKPAAPYKIRTIMERQEGAVCQAFLRVGQTVTQAVLLEPGELRYFTGEIIEAPDIDRGCRTKITVKVDGDVDHLWQNWQSGLHRQTCYGNLVQDLERYCRYTGVKIVNEA